MSTDDLLAREETSWQSFTEALEATSPDRRGVEGVVPGWSTHDVAWHCGAWALHAAEAVDHIRTTGSEAEAPDYDALEEAILAEGRTKSWSQALEHAQHGRERAREAFAAFEDPTPEAVTWFTDEAVVHYQEHGDQIRTFNGPT